MKTFINLFRRNWGLKLLSLVLALIIYYSMRENNIKTRVPQNLFLKGSMNNDGIR